MTSKLFNQIFFLRKSKGKEENLATIYLRITIDGERTEISTQRKCEYSKWNSRAGRVLGKTEEVRELNDHLSSIELRIYSIYKDFTTSGLDVNGEVIKAKFLGINNERSRLLLEIYEEHNKQFAALVGKEY